MSMNYDQPPPYESIPLDPIAPPYTPHGGEPPAAGFIYRQQGAYSELPQSDAKNPRSQPGSQYALQNIIVPMEPQPNVVVLAPAAVPAITPGMLPSKPTNVTCPSCREMIATRVHWKSNMQTHMIALICCVCCLWPCCLFPYFIDSCMSANHFCPKCGAFIGQGVNV